MRASMSILAAAVVAVLGVSVSTQQRVIEKMDAFDYDVAPNWSLPYPKAGYAWGSVPGIFVESDDRILVASRGEIKLPEPPPDGFRLFWGTVRSALNARENE